MKMVTLLGFVFIFTQKKVQSTDRIFMVRPAQFRMNEQTAVNNFYQKSDEEKDSPDLSASAQMEFDLLVKKLREREIDVEVYQDTQEPSTPDSIFPNNWISFHSDLKCVLYPMFAANRRLERAPHLIESLRMKFANSYELFDLSAFENNDQFLEGTGSLVLDRVHKIAYACISERTNESLVNTWCGEMGFTPVLFHAFQTVDGKRVPIYHTNVMLCIGTHFCVVCPDAVDSPDERTMLLASLKTNGRKVIEISEDQVSDFAGNMLELKGAGQKFIVMSSRAFHALTEHQRLDLTRFGEIIHSPLSVIEKYGGGSARCMIAELF